MLPGATHAACTVEMASVVKPVAVAVLDEVGTNLALLCRTPPLKQLGTAGL